MEGHLFYQALEKARENHKEGDKAPDKVYPLAIEDFLAQVTLCVKNSDLQIQIGLIALREFVAKQNSMNDLQKYLPVFSDFFGYIY